MNAHSARFRTSEGFERTEASGFLKGSCTKIVKSASLRGGATRNFSGTCAELCAVLNLIPEEPSYGDGGILYHGWGGGGSASLGGGSYSADATRRDLWAGRFRAGRADRRSRTGHAGPEGGPRRIAHRLPRSTRQTEPHPRAN